MPLPHLFGGRAGVAGAEVRMQGVNATIFTRELIWPRSRNWVVAQVGKQKEISEGARSYSKVTLTWGFSCHCCFVVVPLGRRL